MLGKKQSNAKTDYLHSATWLNSSPYVQKVFELHYNDLVNKILTDLAVVKTLDKIQHKSKHCYFMKLRLKIHFN